MCGLSLKKPHDGRALAEDVKRGNVRALSRLISLVENRDREGTAALQSMDGTGSSAVVIGVTGYPGAGKSTLVDQLARIYRRQGKTVGIIAVDPSSPKTGGALLGDRIRMQDHAGDPGVFIRSMATRGHQGGLIRTAGDVVQVLRAARFDVIVIETVGVGQDEVEIVGVADIVVAVVTPGLGDEVQALKAGLFGMADIVVVNKGDQTGAEVTARQLQEWLPVVLRATAVTGEGIDQVVTAIDECWRTVG